MPKTRRLGVGLVVLALASCATPGGIYKGYESPSKDVKDIAVLEWSTHSNRKVTHIDGKYLHEDQPFFGGVAITIAHLLPGQHSVRVHNNWTSYLNLKDSVTLHPKLESGRSYEVRVEPCKKCDPFEVNFMIVDSATGAIITKATRFGSETYKYYRWMYE